MHPAPTVLVACEGPLDRLRIESALLPLRAKVRLANSVADALEAVAGIPRPQLAAGIVDLGLPGGGALGLGRALSGVPLLARTDRPPEGIPGLQHADAGVVGYIAPLATAAEVRVRFASVCALDDRAGQGGWFSVPVADLPAADIVAWVTTARWSAVASFHDEPGAPARFFLRFHEGALWSAEGPDLTGERALAAVMGLTDGVATVLREPPTDAVAHLPRTIHRATEQAVIEALAASNRARHRLTTVPGLDVPYRLKADRAERVPGSRTVTERLQRVLDGRRTLREAVSAARLVEPADLERVADLRRAGAFEPATGAVMPEPDPPRLELISGAQALAAEVDRAMGARGDARAGAATVMPEDVERRRRGARLRLAVLATVAVALAAAAVVWAWPGGDDSVQVQPLESPP